MNHERAAAPADSALARRRPTRRHFLQANLALAGLGLISGCGLLPPAVQQPPKIPRLGFLASDIPPPNPTQQVFLQALRDLGYVEGQTIAIEYQWAEEREERLPALAAELVGLSVDVIFAWATLPARAAKDATATIPIVFGAANDPVGAGLVASLARPGGNVTGLSAIGSVLSAKRVELLKEAIPGLSRVAVLAYPPGATTERDWTETHEAAQRLGLDPRRHEVSSLDGFGGAFGAMEAEGADALIVLPDSFFGRNQGRVVDLAARHRLPAMYEHRRFADAGGLMSYGANFPDLYRRAATYVDKILKGTRPADLPIEQPTRFEFVVNLKTARALGLTIPQSVLLQATEVLQ